MLKCGDIVRVIDDRGSRFDKQLAVVIGVEKGGSQFKVRFAPNLVSFYTAENLQKLERNSFMGPLLIGDTIRIADSSSFCFGELAKVVEPSGMKPPEYITVEIVSTGKKVNMSRSALYKEENYYE